MTSTSVSNHYYGRDYGGADVESRFIVTFSDNDAWNWCSMLPCRRCVCVCVCSPISVTRASGGCLNQPSSTHTPQWPVVCLAGVSLLLY